MTKDLSGSWLKIIAMLSMTIDHVAYYYGCSNPYLYELMRTVGRIAFPTFAFLLAEGFVYSRNRQKYMLSLFAFALVSEIPWLMLNHDGSHNVLFTLLCSLTQTTLGKDMGWCLSSICSVADLTYRRFSAYH